MDKVRIFACGGAGGQGSSRLGGLGGDGGDVEVCASEGATLGHIAKMKTRRFIASVGGRSVISKVQGKKGANVTIHVPPGTVVYAGDNDVMVITIVGVVSVGAAIFL